MIFFSSSWNKTKCISQEMKAGSPQFALDLLVLNKEDDDSLTGGH